MRKLALIVLTLFSSYWSYCQVEQLIYLKNGQWSKVEYINQNDDTIFVRPDKKKDIVSLARNEIKLMQTLGVYFLGDAYNDYLSAGTKKLDYTQFGSTNKYDFEISGGIIDAEIVLFVRLVYNEFIKEGIYVFEGDIISIQLGSGENVSLSLNRSYLTSGKELKYGLGVTQQEDINYNISYIKLNSADFKKLINSPIESANLRDRKIRVKDQYCIMRHLLALMDETWSY